MTSEWRRERDERERDERRWWWYGIKEQKGGNRYMLILFLMSNTLEETGLSHMMSCMIEFEGNLFFFPCLPSSFISSSITSPPPSLLDSVDVSFSPSHHRCSCLSLSLSRKWCDTRPLPLLTQTALFSLSRILTFGIIHSLSQDLSMKAACDSGWQFSASTWKPWTTNNRRRECLSMRGNALMCVAQQTLLLLDNRILFSRKMFQCVLTSTSFFDTIQ